jgi:hypothetical protein
MKKFVFGTILTIAIITTGTAMEHASNSLTFGVSFGVGTFSAGENEGGSLFKGVSIFADWIPNSKTGLSFGLETGLLGGKKQENNILGIPAIFRFGWYPNFLSFEKSDFFLLGKIGWAFGIWGQNANEGSIPNGIVCGFNFGGRYALTDVIGVCAEIGYNYYGLARNSNYPEYPLGYGSGKTYASFGLSLLLATRD